MTSIFCPTGTGLSVFGSQTAHIHPYQQWLRLQHKKMKVYMLLRLYWPEGKPVKCCICLLDSPLPLQFSSRLHSSLKWTSSICPSRRSRTSVSFHLGIKDRFNLSLHLNWSFLSSKEVDFILYLFLQIYNLLGFQRLGDHAGPLNPTLLEEPNKPKTKVLVLQPAWQKPEFSDQHVFSLPSL